VWDISPIEEIAESSNTPKGSEQTPESQLKNEFERLEKMYLTNMANAPRLSTNRPKTKLDKQAEKQIEINADAIYCEKDPVYGSAVAAAKQEKAELLKQIDYALLPIQPELSKLPRVDKTILAIPEFDLHIRNMPNIDPRWLDGQIVYVIDVLHACKANIQRQTALETEHTAQSAKQTTCASTVENRDPRSVFANPVSLIELVKLGGIKERSDNMAKKMKRHNFKLEKIDSKWYCEAADAAILWPKVVSKWEAAKKKVESNG
jgi:hypothetical protein